MSRNTLNFIIALVSTLIAVSMIATGLTLRFLLPPGSGQARSLWTLTRHDWGDVHFWLAVALGSVILLHVAMHWSWVCGMMTRLARITVPNNRRTLVQYISGAATVAAVIVALTLLLWLGQVGQQGGQVRKEVSRDAASAGSDVRGSMTLAEVAVFTDMSIESIKQHLGLPPSTAADERLGKLRQEYGLSMTDVRKVIREHAGESTLKEKKNGR